MKQYSITARVVLAEADPQEKTNEVEGFLTFSIEAEDFPAAVTAANNLLPMEEFQITGVDEILK